MPSHAGGPHGSLPSQFDSFPSVSPMLFLKARSAAVSVGSETALAVANSISRLVKTSNPEYILGPFIFRAGTMTITILGKNYGNHLQARNDASTVDSIVVSSSNNCITSPPGILLQPRTILQLITQLHVKLVAVELRC